MIELERFRAHLEHARRASPHTVRNYLSDLEQYAAWLDEKQIPLEQATHQIIRAYLATLAEGKKETSRARKLASVRS